MIPGHARRAGLGVELGLQANAFDQVRSGAQSEALRDSSLLDRKRQIRPAAGEEAVLSAVGQARKGQAHARRCAQPKPRQPEHRNSPDLEPRVHEQGVRRRSQGRVRHAQPDRAARRRCKTRPPQCRPPRRRAGRVAAAGAGSSGDSAALARARCRRARANPDRLRLGRARPRNRRDTRASRAAARQRAAPPSSWSRPSTHRARATNGEATRSGVTRLVRDAGALSFARRQMRRTSDRGTR